MFIAHLPAGYICTKKLQKVSKTKKYLWIGLFASILPDLDIFYFYFIDLRKHLHHSYWIHRPFYWLLIACIVFITLFLLKRKGLCKASIIFFANIFLHLFLDTVVGQVEWLYPFSDKSHYLFYVPSVYNFWVYNFIFHWTFLFEIGIIMGSIYLLLKEKIGLKQKCKLAPSCPSP